MILNLYVQVPSADARAGFLQEVRTAPLGLTLHALLGTGLICAAVVLLAGAGHDFAAVIPSCCGLAPGSPDPRSGPGQ